MATEAESGGVASVDRPTAAAVTAAADPTLPNGCREEASARWSYASPLNETTHRVCDRQRSEHVCVVGAGTAGVHMGWLLRRRGFRVTIFEALDRVGGKVHTVFGGVGGDGVTREASAAFLSPDYVETRGLTKRFNVTDVPVSVSQHVRFHADNGTAELSTAWAAAWVANITGTNDTAKNNAVVAAALKRYFAVHAEIFGNYTGRMPPRPRGDAAAARIEVTMLEFLKQEGLEVLHPFFYQFVTMQGMGLLGEQPAWYALRWVSPASINAGGFGNDKDTPLALLKEGYGTVLQRMIDDVNLTVMLSTRVTSIARDASGVRIEYVANAPSGAGGGTASRSSSSSSSSLAACDMVILTGPIPQFVRGSEDGTVQPILKNPTPEETSVFAPMRPMQFLITLAKLDPPPSDFQALEYWPSHFTAPSGVIVHRDILCAEDASACGRAIGGIQSYSYWPVPTANRSSHWASQVAWAKAQGVRIEDVYVQNYFDTYYYHYSDPKDVSAGKPWMVNDMQLLPSTRTIYAGGAANYETVEDTITYNLELVSRLFDAAEPVAPAAPALEQLLVTVACADVDAYLQADHDAWTTFLRRQPGFLHKWVTEEPRGGVSNGGVGALDCALRIFVLWETRDLWKAIPAAELNATLHRFNTLFPKPSTLAAIPPSGEGLDVALEHIATLGGDADAAVLTSPSAAGTDDDGGAAGATGAVEVINYSVPCVEIDRFVAADNTTWTPFLASQLGFRRKLVMAPSAAPPSGVNCTVWSMTFWESRTLWHAIPVPGLEATAERFAAAFGGQVPLQRFPTAVGLDVLRDAEPSGPSGPSHPPPVRVPAINGNDVVAYFFLKPGDKDVRGSPEHVRLVNATDLLPPELLSLHPEPYTFWFSSEANARLFESDPWRYIPANGGHCTHGIASRSDLTPALLVDGRVAFTCVNTTRWAVVGGRLYMNSCGMYKDFEKDPAGDVATSQQRWGAWFKGMRGPINDRCFQDGGLFRDGGSPVADLIPPKCVIN